MKKKLIAIVIILTLLQSYITCISMAATQQELEQQKEDTKNDQQQAKDELEDVQEELSAQMKEIEELDVSINEEQEELDKLTARVNELQEAIEQKTEEIAQKEEDYQKQDQLLRDRLVAIYKGGRTSYLDVLLTSDSLTDFISNYYLIGVMADNDAKIMQKIEQEKIDIENAKVELENTKQEVEVVKDQQAAKTQELKDKRAERQKKADSLSEDEKALQNKIDEYDKKLKSIENSLQEVLRKAEEDRKRREQQAAAGGGSAGIHFDGSFIWPCNNKYVTSRVKIRWGRWHKGIDIGARYENVYAAASGYAYNAYDRNGYGTYVMIIHGDGYITLYGHLNSSHVSDGQYVSQGQVIATSGNSGSSTAPHLHFEIRKASSISSYFSTSFLNPLDYLPSGYTILD